MRSTGCRPRRPRGRDAEPELVSLRLQLSQIQDVPWGASPEEGDHVDDVRGELEWMKEEIQGSLDRLSRDGGLPERSRMSGWPPTMDGIGRAYRMGGDEFCITAPVAASGAAAISALAATALSDEGSGFAIGCSYGFAVMPVDTTRAEEALLLADQRMYAHKGAGRVSPSRQSADVLLRLLAERNLELERHTAEREPVA